MDMTWEQIDNWKTLSLSEYIATSFKGATF